MTAHCGKGQHPPTTIVHFVHPDHDRDDDDVDDDDDNGAVDDDVDDGDGEDHHDEDDSKNFDNFSLKAMFSTYSQQP